MNRRDFLANFLATPAAVVPQAEPSSGGDNDLRIKASGGRVSRSLSDRFGEIVNVLDFGCRGDGRVDDTKSMDEAIAYSRNRNLPVYLPPGAYKRTLPLPSFTELFGPTERHANASILLYGAPLWLVDQQATPHRPINRRVLRNLRVDCTHANSDSIVRLNSTYSITIEKMIFEGFSGGQCLIDVIGCHDVRMNRIVASYTGKREAIGIRVARSSATILEHDIEGFHAGIKTERGREGGPTMLTILGGYCEANKYALWFDHGPFDHASVHGGAYATVDDACAIRISSPNVAVLGVAFNITGKGGAAVLCDQVDETAPSSNIALIGVPRDLVRGVKASRG